MASGQTNDKKCRLKKAGITEATGYQYFDGKRNPSREKMIALAIGFSLTLEETNELLKKLVMLSSTQNILGML